MIVVDRHAPVLVTGAAGFIGYHVSAALLRSGRRVLGVDNLNAYYDPRLKEARLARLRDLGSFQFAPLDLADTAATDPLVARHGISEVIHLAAQAGVRYSLEHPHAYASSNLTGFLNILESCRHARVRHLVYASSSSVYGANTKMPFSVSDNVDHPVSLYAATKKANELMAYTYSHLYRMPVTGLRFFTVYGPWGRPDMAYFKFTQAILAGRPIDVYNHGDLLRDYTYIDDIVEGVLRVLERPPNATQRTDTRSDAPYRLYNIGNSRPVPLLEFIATLEQALGIAAVKRLLPMQPGDVYATFADTSDLERDVGFAPATPLAEGLRRFVEWYREYYSVSEVPVA